MESKLTKKNISSKALRLAWHAKSMAIITVKHKKVNIILGDLGEFTTIFFTSSPEVGMCVWARVCFVV